MDNQNRYAELEREIEYTFRDKKHLDIAFTHTSYANEKMVAKLPSYERYEFLGDAILEFISSEYLYENYPELPEGKLTKLRARQRDLLGWQYELAGGYALVNDDPAFGIPTCIGRVV